MAKTTLHGGATDVNQDGETVVVGVPTVGVPRIGEGGDQAPVSHVEGENVLLTDVQPADESAAQVEQLPEGQFVTDDGKAHESEGTGEPMTGVEVPLGETAEISNEEPTTDDSSKSKPKKSTAPKA